MKKQQFIALNREIWVPDNCYFHDLGESENFADNIRRYVMENFKDNFELNRDVFELTCKNDFRQADGYTLHLLNNEEKHNLIIYRPEGWKINEEALPNFRYWFARGHEEGHALFNAELYDEIRNIAGDIDYSNKEAICDIIGLHAADIRGFGNLVTEEKRRNLERAKYWRKAYTAAKRNEIEARKKKGETQVLTADFVLEKIIKKMSDHR